LSENIHSLLLFFPAEINIRLKLLGLASVARHGTGFALRIFGINYTRQRYGIFNFTPSLLLQMFQKNRLKFFAASWSQKAFDLLASENFYVGVLKRRVEAGFSGHFGWRKNGSGELSDDER
jgi:hypothetical protein